MKTAKSHEARARGLATQKGFERPEVRLDHITVETPRGFIAEPDHVHGFVAGYDPTDPRDLEIAFSYIAEDIQGSTLEPCECCAPGAEIRQLVEELGPEWEATVARAETRWIYTIRHRGIVISVFTGSASQTIAWLKGARWMKDNGNTVFYGARSSR